MLGSLGLILYLVASIIRPADWWKPLLGSPIDKWVFALLLLALVASGKVARLGRLVVLPQSLVILGCFFVQLVSILAAGVFSSFGLYLGLYAKLFCVYAAFALFADSVPKIRWLLVAFATLAAVVAIQSIQMVGTGVGWAGQEMYWGHRVRWVGMYDGANVLCLLFVIAMAFLLHLVVGPWGVASKVLGAVSSALIVVGIYLTNSRGGFLAFAAVVGVFLLLRGEAVRRIGPKKLVAMAVVLGLLLLVAPSRMEAIRDEEHSSSGRIDAWQEGLEMLKDRPLLGVGQGQWLQHHYLLAHNSLVQTMGETGLIGLFAWIAMLYLFVKSMIAVISEAADDRAKSAARAVLTAFCGFLLGSLFVTTVQFDLWYIFFGLTAARLLPTETRVSLARSDYVRIVALTVGGVALVYLTVRVFYVLKIA